MTDEPLLEIDNLSINYETRAEDVRAVSDASFDIGDNEFLGLVGESGCGKSTLAKSIIGGLDSNGQVESGAIRYRGKEIQDYSEKEYNEDIRWSEISVIPQAAMNSLDPTMRISKQAVELAGVHTDWSNQRALDELGDMFDVVGLSRDRIDDYPHQFSGGMKQRAVIAFALFLDPSLIIADEPTTALDVIMQDQILKYFDKIKEARDVSLLMITHDISVVFETCDSMAIMHGGQVAESGDIIDLYENPRHPYSILLQGAFPDIREPEKELSFIEGTPPTQHQEIDHCSFADRCPWAVEECRASAPPLEEVDQGAGHRSSCIRWREIPDIAEEHLEGITDNEPVSDGTTVKGITDE